MQRTMQKRDMLEVFHGLMAMSEEVGTRLPLSTSAKLGMVIKEFRPLVGDLERRRHALEKQYKNDDGQLDTDGFTDAITALLDETVQISFEGVDVDKLNGCSISPVVAERLFRVGVLHGDVDAIEEIPKLVKAT